MTCFSFLLLSNSASCSFFAWAAFSRSFSAKASKASLFSLSCLFSNNLPRNPSGAFGAFLKEASLSFSFSLTADIFKSDFDVLYNLV